MLFEGWFVLGFSSVGWLVDVVKDTGSCLEIFRLAKVVEDVDVGVRWVVVLSFSSTEVAAEEEHANGLKAQAVLEATSCLRVSKH